MQDTDPPGSVRSDLLDRLKALDSSNGAGSLAELAYRRAREALENALEEARTIRLRAIEDARRTRERETATLQQALLAQHEAAEAEIEALIREAEIEAERIRAEAHQQARTIILDAKAEAQRELQDADRTVVEARVVRVAADEREREVERLEGEFNATLSRVAARLGIVEEPSRGWLRRITQRGDGRAKG